ncbi:MAG: hypothetical protein WD225_08400, partial [Ilumatobacteraceae bacterium]
MVARTRVASGAVIASLVRGAGRDESNGDADGYRCRGREPVADADDLAADPVVGDRDPDLVDP